MKGIVCFQRVYRVDMPLWSLLRPLFCGRSSLWSLFDLRCCGRSSLWLGISLACRPFPACLFLCCVWAVRAFAASLSFHSTPSHRLALLLT